MLVSRNKKEIQTVPTCGGFTQFGGFRHERREMQQANLPPATAPHIKQCEDAHKFGVKDSMGENTFWVARGLGGYPHRALRARSLPTS